MNLGEARAELEARGYSRFADTRLNTWLGTAVTRFEDYQFDWPWLRATQTGSAPLTIADLRRVRSVASAATRTGLMPLDPDAIVEFVDSDLALAGEAGAWYLSSETVVSTYPTTASLTVRYVKFSPALDDDSDSPLIPERYHQTWVDLAEVEVLRYGVKDFAQAAGLDAVVQARLGEIAAVFEMQDEQAYQQTLVTGASVDG